MYSKKVVTSRKRCKIKTLLLQTTDRDWCQNSDISNNLERISRSFAYCKLCQMRFFVGPYSWEDFRRLRALHGLSSIAELHVNKYDLIHRNVRLAFQSTYWDHLGTVALSSALQRQELIRRWDSEREPFTTISHTYVYFKISKREPSSFSELNNSQESTAH